MHILASRPAKPKPLPSRWFATPWLHAAGQRVAIVGACVLVLGLPTAVTGYAAVRALGRTWASGSPQMDGAVAWYLTGVGLSVLGFAALVFGLLAVICGRRIRP